MTYKIKQLEPYLGQQEIENLTRTIEQNWITEGPYAKKFVEKLKQETNAKYIVLAPNGTLALFLSLLALNIKEGDEVIVPNFTFIASATSVAFTGAKPVFIDVELETGNIDVNRIEELITPNTKAIMPVHMYGHSCDLDPIITLAQKYHLKVIEDAAQGYGVFYKRKHVGTFSDAGTISFYADKTVTMGEGAVIMTNNEKLYKKLLLLRNQGRPHSSTFEHPALGMNFRITDMQAAIGCTQLDKFDEIYKIKTENYLLYKELLQDVKEITFLQQPAYTNFVPFRANILVDRLDDLIQFMEDKGIQTRKLFFPLHRQPCFKYLGYKSEEFPNSNRLNQTGLSLPVHCLLKEENIAYICKTITSFFN